MKIISWLIIIVIGIIGLGVFLYFIPITQRLVIDMVGRVPIVAKYLPSTEKNIDELTLLKEKVKNLTAQLDTVKAQLDQEHSEKILLQSQLKEKDKMINNLNVQLNTLKESLNQRSTDIKKLASAIENMDAKSAAKLISALEEDKAVEILRLLDKEKIGEILTNLDTGKAVSLSKKMGWGG
jgi:flagellar motility protein MotE (MotC chaperone)